LTRIPISRVSTARPMEQWANCDDWTR
jgi:hypothetical protein